MKMLLTKSRWFDMILKRRISILRGEPHLQPYQTTSKYIFGGKDVLGGDIQGSFTVENIFKKVVPILKRKFLS